MFLNDNVGRGHEDSHRPSIRGRTQESFPKAQRMIISLDCTSRFYTPDAVWPPETRILGKIDNGFQ